MRFRRLDPDPRESTSGSCDQASWASQVRRIIGPQSSMLLGCGSGGLSRFLSSSDASRDSMKPSSAALKDGDP